MGKYCIECGATLRAENVKAGNTYCTPCGIKPGNRPGVKASCTRTKKGSPIVSMELDDLCLDLRYIDRIS